MFPWKDRPLKKKLKQVLDHKDIPTFSNEEQSWIAEIRSVVKLKNRNNVSRTEAYWDFYTKHPEMHWALLAHLVSRNAGWNMTDLKGEHLSQLLTAREQTDFFLFLERGNWLIFQDAYPQLLLLDKSIKLNRSLTHLLPAFGVSSFMVPLWDHYIQSGDSSLITRALIVNEQHYIENRVIQNPHYKNTVTDTVLFKLQDLLNMNHILIPYTTPSLKQRKLFGHSVHHFSSLEERIRFGKELYDLLYSIQSRLSQVQEWAKYHPHTGSRKDYWPALYNDVRERVPHKLETPLEKPCNIHGNEARFFSPTLGRAWDDQIAEPAEQEDWFTHLKQLHFLTDNIKRQDGDVLPLYCDSIEKLEFALVAKKALRKKEKESELN
ncbi:DUF2515 family protein [Halobacillus salinus]|uniref:DUF2515 family protein n=1 Tax=Halobacillus salinus TaxID=192814 RepID=UPI0009A60336|nr:DUF2515 family protein [Halobacillus salinus]